MALKCRVVFSAVEVPTRQAPYNALHLRVFYPADANDPDTLKKHGMMRALTDETKTPFPVLVFANGMNCGPEQYRWLAERLAVHRIVTVFYSFVGEDFKGMPSLTPGLDITKLSPATYGSGPVSDCLGPIFAQLERMNSGEAPSPLQGLLDLDHVALGGHSAGGTAVLESLSPSYFPRRCSQVVRRLFVRGTHSSNGRVSVPSGPRSQDRRWRSGHGHWWHGRRRCWRQRQQRGRAGSSCGHF